MVPGPIDGSVTLLKTLHENGVPLYSITNFAADTFAETVERFAFLALFRDTVVSAEERIAKPDRRIFVRAMERFGIAPERTLFIDDLEANVAAARGIGLHAVRFTSPETLRIELAAYGLPVN